MIARAGAPLVTDDASIIESKSCQFETWANGTQGARNYWIVPACNFGGGVELSLGLADVNPQGEPGSYQTVLQAKTVFTKAADGAWSIGAVAGVGHDSGPPAAGASSTAYYAKGLLSLYLNDELEVDLNLGTSNDFGAGAIVAAGAAIQYQPLPRTTLLAEIFRDEKGAGKYQVGLRYAIVPDRFEAFASYGNRLGNPIEASWWATLGIKINTAAFLP